MNVKYHIRKSNKGYVLSGTPARIVAKEALVLLFDIECEAATVFVNHKKYQLLNGACSVPASSVSPLLEISLRYIKDGITYTAECESLFERDGYLYGQKETLDSFCKLKHATVALMKASEELEARTAALERKCAELEHKLNGTDIFDLNEQEKEK